MQIHVAQIHHVHYRGARGGDVVNVVLVEGAGSPVRSHVDGVGALQMWRERGAYALQ